MNFLNHLVLNNNELQSARWHRLSSAPTAYNAGMYFNTTDTRFYGSRDGSTWKKFLIEGDVSPGDIPLTNGNLLRGNGSNVAASVAPSTIPISSWGAAIATVDFGNQWLDNVKTPTADLHAANKAYVDSVAQGLAAKDACRAATTAALPAATYNNGAGTLTATANGALPAQDGVTLIVGDRLLVKNQASQFQNGIYEVTQVGSAGYTPWILTRSDDANIASELTGAFTFVQAGTVNSNTGWTQTADNITLGTTNIVWVQFSGAGSYSAGNGLVLSGSVFHFQGSGAYTNGDMFFANGAATIGRLTVGASNRFLYSTGSAPAYSAYALPAPGSTLTANQLMYASSTTQMSGLATANNAVLVTNGSGVPSLSTDLPTAATIGGNYIYRASGTDVPLADGGTNASLTAVNGGLVYSSATALAITAAGTSGHFVRSGGAGAPTFFNLFGTANSWTAAQTFNSSSTPSDTVVIDIAAMGVAGTRDSNWLKFTGRSYDTVPHNVDWIAFVSPDLNSGAQSTFHLQARVDAASYADAFTVSTTATTKWAMGAGILTFVSGANFMDLSFAGLTGSRSLVLPDASGTLALTTNTTFGSGSVWNGSLIGIAYGGTGSALTATTGSILYGNGTVFTTATGTNGQFMRWNTSGAPSSFNLFATANTWTAGQTFNNGTTPSDTLIIDIDALGSAGVRNSNWIKFVARSNDGAAHNVDWAMFVEPTANSGNTSVFRLRTRKDAGSWADAFSIANTTGGTTSWALNTGFIQFNNNGNLTDLYFNASTVDRVITLPDATGTVALTTGSTFGAGSIWNGNVIGLAYGGLNANITASNGGIFYSTATAGALLAGVAAASRMLFSGNSAAPSWSAYSMPTTMAANSLFLGSSSTAVTTLAPTNNRLLHSSSSGVVSWGAVLNPLTSGTLTVARIYTAQMQGDNTNAYIDVTHNLNTRSVTWNIRNSNSTDSVVNQEFVFTKVEVTGVNTLRVYFSSVQSNATYYNITVVG